MITVSFLQRLLSSLFGGGSAPQQSYSFGQPNAGYAGASYGGGGAYGRIISMIGTTGKSEAEVRSDLAGFYFNPADVDKLCATPAFRQLMGWG